VTGRATPNLAASVHQRLLNLSRSQGRDHTLVLRRYALERLLYRLGVSTHADRFVLKGATLFSVWDANLYRPTRDLDLLAFGDASAAALTMVFADLCNVVVEPDGIMFDRDSIRVSEIREHQQYGGQRVDLNAMLGSASIPVQVDIVVGDAVTPPAALTDLPVMLPFPAPRLCIYPKETVVAEKLQAMVVLGMLNSRLKDYYDIWYLSRTMPFDGKALCAAIQATFERRATAIPSSIPVGLTASFAQEQGRSVQWTAFLRRHGLLPLNENADLGVVVAEVAAFLMPCLEALTGNGRRPSAWPPGGPWSRG
jgi:predicted nucleotidyltransferase component of viral defense system